MDLTKEYFDGELKLNREYFEEHLDQSLKGLESRMNKHMEDFVTQAFETQQVWIDERFKELIVPYDVRKRVVKLEDKVEIINNKLGISAN